MLVSGDPAVTVKANTVGLERAGIAPRVIRALGQAHRIVYRDGLAMPNAIARIEAELPPSAELSHFTDFIRHSERGITK